MDDLKDKKQNTEEESNPKTAQEILMTEENLSRVAELLKVLANENRLMILCVLLNHSLSVSEIGSQVSHITQSALSQHLSVLKAHRILKSKKIGQAMIYSIDDPRIKEILQVLKNHYCC